MPVYATPDDVENVDVAGDLAAQLAYASALIDEHVLTALYATDEDGRPTDPTGRDAFRDAVVAQVKTWAALKIDPALGPAGVTREGSVTTKSIGSASISRSASSRAADDLANTVSSLTPTARALVDSALRARRVWVTG